MADVHYADVVNSVREALPEFAPAITEHLADYGEPLPHVLFGDLTRFLEDAWAQGDQLLVRRGLMFLNDALKQGDDQVQNLVAVSFVENVQPWDKGKQEFIDTWPPELRAEAQRQKHWRPST